MTDKELKKLKRADLLEILYYLQKEVEELTKENESLKAQLENSKSSFFENDLDRIVKAVESAVRDAVKETAQNQSNETNNDNANIDEKGKQNNGDGKTDEA